MPQHARWACSRHAAGARRRPAQPLGVRASPGAPPLLPCSHADYRSNPKFPLSLRLPYMTDLVAEAECKR